MKRFLLLLLFIGLALGQVDNPDTVGVDNNQDIIEKNDIFRKHNLSIGMFDDKTGMSLIGYTYNFQQKEMDEPASHIQDSLAVSENKAVINYYQLGYDQAEADLKNGKWDNDRLLSGGLGVAGILFTGGVAYLIDRLRSVDTMAIKAGLNVKIDEMSDEEIKFYVSGYEKRIKEMRFWTSTAGFCSVPIVLIGIIIITSSPTH